MQVDIEVCLKPMSAASPADIGRVVTAWLKTRAADVVEGPLDLSSLTAKVRDHIQSARVCEFGAAVEHTLFPVAGADSGAIRVQYTDDGRRRVPFALADARVYVYQLNNDGASSAGMAEALGSGDGAGGGGGDGDDSLAAYTQWTLPAAEFEGLWESLLYGEDDEEGEEEKDRAGGAAAATAAPAPAAAATATSSSQEHHDPEPDIKGRLLRYASASLAFADAGASPHLLTANHVVLLHGPPGTGKTSLCKAIAQKVSIRLGDRYPTASLIEINAHSLFSRWFSESGKTVARLFGHINELVEDEESFVCVLIDEVESLTAARKAAVSGSEPSDAVRVVNAVLTAIDALRTRPNVLLLTTSNVCEAIDVAFVDRADVRAYVGPPGTAARYDILASCLTEMMRVGIAGAVVPAETATAPASAAAGTPSPTPAAASLLPVSLVRHQAALSLWKRLRELHAATPPEATATNTAPRSWEATLTALVQEGCAAHTHLHKAWVRESFDAAAAVAGGAVSARAGAPDAAGIIGSGREAYIMSAIVPGLAYTLFAPRSAGAGATATSGAASSRDETMRGASTASAAAAQAPLLALTPSALTSITLLQSAVQAKGCSGRALRKLPLQAQARFFRPAITRTAGGAAGAASASAGGVARTVDASTPHPCMMAFALGRTAVIEKAARASLEA